MDSISQNAVEVDVKVSNGDALDKLAGNMENIKKLAGGGVDDPYKKLKTSANQASDGISKISSNVNKTTDALKGGESKASSFTDKLKAIKDITFDKARSGATKFTAKLKEAASVNFDKLKSGISNATSALGKGALSAAKFTAKGIGLAATGIATLTGLSVNAYGDYEQLVGGVQTLFGTGGLGIEDYAVSVGKSVQDIKSEYDGLIAAQQSVLTNANNAYKTAGMSANNYMETVTAFSASLKQSFDSTPKGIKAAGDAANKAVIAMADNSNKLGTPMESIRDAYQGFAKQNYTMLDNLKLGYGGTKTEMERLLKDAQAWTGVKYDINNLADVFSAVSAIQDKLGITGTTAKEASETIQGSALAMKASWGNLLTSFVSGGSDFDQCVDNMIESVKTFGKNVLPAVQNALGGIGKFIEEMAPIIAAELPGLTEQILPPLIKAAGSVMQGIIKALPTIVGVLIKEIPGIVRMIADAVGQAFGDSFPFIYTFASAISGCADGIGKAVPFIIAGVLAFKGFSIVKTAAGFLKSFKKPLETTSKASKGLLTSAKAFALMAVGVLAIAAAFAILAHSAIALAQAGPLAIGVMGGMVVAVAALGLGMMLLLKSLSTVGAEAIKGAAAMAILGGALILISAGFALLTHSAISLASAGPLAIGVMVGLVATIALLAVGAAAIGPALTAGAVGFIAFGAAILLASAGIYLIAQAVQVVTPALIALVTVVGGVVNTIVNSIGNVLVNCISAAGSAISGILEGISNIFLSFGEGVKLIIEGIGSAISSVLDAVAGIFDSIGNAAKNAGIGFESVARGLKTISEISIVDLVKSLGAVGDGMKTVAQHSEGVALAAQGMQTLTLSLLSIAAAADSIMTICITLPTLLGVMSGAAAALGGMVSPTVELLAVTAPLASAFIAMASSSTVLAASIMLTTSSMYATVASTQALSAAANTVFSAMERTVTSKCTKIVNTTKKCANDIKSAFSTIDLNLTGKNIMQGLIDGIESKRSSVLAKAKAIARAISTEMNAALDIHSPSRITMRTGEFAAEGLIVGMQNKLPKIKETSQRIASNTGVSIDDELRAYSGGEVQTARTRVSDNIRVAPVFHLEINGQPSDDDRALGRKVRRWVREEFEEVIESMTRRKSNAQYI